MRNSEPLISFTFDDFPRSALEIGGDILKKHALRGTYFAAIGLMDQDAPVGRIFAQDDLRKVVEDGHELGCHTFHHCNAWKTKPQRFEESVVENSRSLQRFVSNAAFATLSYPLAEPRPFTKRRVARHFLCCRGGGQTYNQGHVQQTHVNAFFLEQSRHDPAAIRRVITENANAGGWLVFATHDVCDNPSRFGCTPGFFDSVVRDSIASQAKILPMRDAWKVATGIDTFKTA